MVLAPAPYGVCVWGGSQNAREDKELTMVQDMVKAQSEAMG